MTEDEPLVGLTLVLQEGRSREQKSRTKKGKEGKGRTNVAEEEAAVYSECKTICGGGDRARAQKGIGILRRTF